MATTLRTMLTAAGANLATATIVLQTGVGAQPGPGVPRVDTQANVPLNGTTITNTNAALDKRIVTPFDFPRCVVIDATSIYLPMAVSNSNMRYIKVPITATQYTTGNQPVPIITDLAFTNWQGYQGPV